MKKEFQYAKYLICLFAANIFSFYKVGLDDHWWHLATGKKIFENGSSPKTDIFSFTFYGKPVDNWEWLWDLSTYSIYHVTGPTGLIFLRIIISFLLFLFLWSIIDHFTDTKTDNNHFFFNSLGTFVFALLIHPRLSDRPHLAGYLFMCLTIFITIKGFKKWPYLFFLPFLMAIWVPVHPSWPIGFLLFGTISADNLLLNRKNSEIIKQILPKLIISIVISLILITSLYTKSLISYFSHSNDLNNMNILTEWMSFPQSFRASPYNFYFLISILLFVYSALKKMKKHPLYIIITSLFVIQALLHVRFIAEFSILSTPLIFAVFNEKEFFHIKGKKVYILMLLLFTGLSLHSRNYWNYKFGRGVDKQKNPVEAVEFLRKMNIKGNLYSPQMEAHNYVLFKLTPDVKVFIDGRIPLLYPINFLDKFNSSSISSLSNEGYEIDIILINNGIYKKRNVKFIKQLTNYNLVFFSENDAVFIRKNSAICLKCMIFKLLNPWRMTENNYLESLKTGSKRNLEPEIKHYKQIKKKDFFKEIIINSVSDY